MCLVHFRYCTDCQNYFHIPRRYFRENLRQIELVVYDILCGHLSCLRFPITDEPLEGPRSVPQLGQEGVCGGHLCSLLNCGIIRVYQTCFSERYDYYYHSVIER